MHGLRVDHIHFAKIDLNQCPPFQQPPSCPRRSSTLTNGHKTTATTKLFHSKQAPHKLRPQDDDVKNDEPLRVRDGLDTWGWWRR